MPRLFFNVYVYVDDSLCIIRHGHNCKYEYVTLWQILSLKIKQIYSEASFWWDIF